MFHLICKFGKIETPTWFSSYFADLLCMPLLLSYSVIMIRKIKKTPSLILNKKMILFAFIYVSIVFEIILPEISTKFTRDYLDILMYFIGSIVFYLFQGDFVHLEP